MFWRKSKFDIKTVCVLNVKGFEKLKLAKTAGCGTERDKYVSEAVEVCR